MKVINIYKGIAAGAAMLMFVSCQESIELISYSDGMVSSITATSTDWLLETGQTRALSVSSAGSLTFSWATCDVLGIYPIGGDQVAFPISNGAGSATANFDGGSWALRSTYQYAAYYPFNTDNYTISQTEIPVSLIGQTQDGNNSLSTASPFDFQAAAATQPSANGSVNLSFKHLCCFMKLKLTMAKPGTYTHVKVTSDNTMFGTKAKFDLTATTPVLVATETSASVEMDLTNITTDFENELVTIYNLAVPMNLSGSNLTIEVTDDAGNKYTNQEVVAGKNMAAGYQYGYAATMGGSGTGGTGSDIPAEEELIDGHAYVDLGLPSGLLWATCNIGAEKPEDYGDYYAWGETETKTNYAQETYSLRITDDCNLFTEYDAAQQKWGGPSSWHMPTTVDFQELRNYCTWKWCKKNNVNGYKVTGDNGRWIFLPAAGYRDDMDLMNDRETGYYWTCVPYGCVFEPGLDPDLKYALCISFDCFNTYMDLFPEYRYRGLCVRPVTYIYDY